MMFFSCSDPDDLLANPAHLRLAKWTISAFASLYRGAGPGSTRYSPLDAIGWRNLLKNRALVWNSFK